MRARVVVWAACIIASLSGCAGSRRPVGLEGFEPGPLPSRLDLSDVLGTDPSSGIDGWTWLMWPGAEDDVTILVHCACLPEDIAMRPDERGYFFLKGIPRGWYTVELVRRGDEHGDVDELGLIGGDGRMHESITSVRPRAHVDLSEGEADSSWAGGILQLDGQPLPHVFLYVFVPELGRVDVRTDERGRFSVRGSFEKPQPRRRPRPIEADIGHLGWTGKHELKRDAWTTIDLRASAWSWRRETITSRSRRPDKSLFWYRDPLGGPLISYSLP